MTPLWPSWNSTQHNVSSLPLPSISTPSSRRLRSLSVDVSTSSSSCDPRIGHCRFDAVFSVEVVGNDRVLESVRAREVFSYLGTRWLNECVVGDDVTSTSFFGLFFDEDDDDDVDQLIRRDERRLNIRSGRASGKCRGIGCPRENGFTFPNRRRRRRRLSSSWGKCDGLSFFSELRLYPDFASLDPLQSGEVVVMPDVSSYRPMDFCDEEICWNEQRYAAQAFLLKVGFDRAINDMQHHCSWQGVRCNEKREISGIFLRKQKLSGTIASELGKLESLENVDLAENELYGTIPSQLGQLSNLKSLLLSDNGLTGTVPTELALLRAQGVYFTINGNDIVGDMSFFCPVDDTTVTGCRPTSTPTSSPTSLPTSSSTSLPSSSPTSTPTSSPTSSPTSTPTSSPTSTPTTSWPTSSSPTTSRPSQQPTDFSRRMFGFLQRPVQTLMIATGAIMASFFLASFILP